MKARISGMWRSLAAILMALCMVIGLVPTTAFATEEYSVEDVKAALEEMSQFVAENYEQAYADAYAYAEENGYIAYADAALDAALAALADLDLSELDPELVDEAEALIAESADALGAAKALLAEADVLDPATLESFMALVNEGVEAFEALVALLDAAGVFAAIEEAYNELLAAIPVVEAKLTEAIQAAVDALIAEIEAKLAEIDAAIAAELAALKAELEAAIAEIKAELEAVKAELEAKLAELEAKLAELNAKLEAAVEEAKAAIEAAIAEVEAAIAAVKAKLAEIKAALEELKAAVKAMNAAVEEMLAEGVAAFNKVQAALNEMAAKAAELVAVASEEAAAKLAEAVAALKAMLNELYLNATHGEYTLTADSHYVALGDATAVSESYVDVLAAAMANISGEDYSYTNLSEAGMMIQDVYAVLDANAEEIAQADLVTLGFGNNGFTQFALAEVMALLNEKDSAIDWSLYVGAEGLPYVADVKADLYEEVLAATGDAASAALVTAAAEAYAYSYVAYTCNLPEVVNAIHAISPEALVVVVGMYNPLENVVLEMNGQELSIGDYVQYMVDAANVSALAFAMLTQDAVYVDAPAVEVANTKTVLSVEELAVEVIYYNCEVLNPTEAGHTYIAEQILNALTITVGLLGDADSNGVVNAIDAMYVLQYYTGANDGSALNLDVCDVDGNGVVNALDAMFILQYYTGAIAQFPVEA